MTGDVDATPAAPAAPADAAFPAALATPLQTVTEALGVVSGALQLAGRRLAAESAAADASVEKIARATAGLARAALAVLALDRRLGAALAADAAPSADPPPGPTDEAQMDDAVDGPGGEGADADGEPPPEEPDLEHRLARMAWRLGLRGGPAPVDPAGGEPDTVALGLPGP